MPLAYEDLDYVDVSIGVLQNIDGDTLAAEVVFEPQFDMAVHTASKNVIYGTQIKKTLSNGSITQRLLASDTRGLSLTNFDWKVTIRATGLTGIAQEKATFERRLRLLRAAPVIDLDILQPVPQPSRPDLVLPVVTSIAGLTGEVTAVQLAAAGVGSSGGSTDPEVVRDVIGTALTQGQHVAIVVDDAGDTITIGVNAQSLTTSTWMTGAFLQRWRAGTAFKAGVPVINAQGQIVSAKTDFTTGATYDAADWLVLSSSALDLTPGSATRTALDAAYVQALICAVKGDGTTDDAAVIQARLDQAAAAGGGRVLVPAGAGAVVVGATLLIGSNTTLELAPGLTLRRKTGFVGNLISNKAAAAGTGRDTNIGLLGGRTSLIDGAANASATGVGLHHIKFRQIDGLTITGFRMSTTSGKYAVNIGNCTDFDVSALRLTTSSDGVHINGPATRGRIANISGATADDLVSLTSTDYVAYNDTVGDITDVDISDITGTTTGSIALVKFATASDTRIDGITGRNWRHTGKRCVLSIAKDTGVVNIGTIRVSQISGWGIVYDGGKVDQLHVNGWDATMANNTTAPVLRMMSSFDVISITDPAIDAAGTGNDLVFIDNAAAVTGDSIVVRGGRGKGAGANVVNIAGTNGTVRRVVVSDLSRPGPGSSGGVVKNRGSLAEAFLTNVDVNTAAWLGDFGGTALTRIFATNCFASNGVFTFASGAVAHVYAENITGGVTTTINSGTNIRSLSYGFGVDVTKLGNLTAIGDRCNNTNTTLGGGLLRGPATYDGSLWRSVVDPTKTSAA